jgi:hypothetical protein
LIVAPDVAIPVLLKPGKKRDVGTRRTR